MSLIDWQKNGWLLSHQTSRQEIAGLLAIAARDLKDCQTQGLGDDWKFNIAYNCTLQSSFAALYASGYRVPKGDSHHFRVIQSLQFTIGLTSNEIALFDAFRKKRNMVVYDISGAISPADAKQMIQFALTLSRRVVQWLHDQHSKIS